MTRHDQIAVDAVRGRLGAILELREGTARPCEHCHGTGTIQATRRRHTQTDVAEVCGVSRTQITNFLGRRTDLSMSAGLLLMRWLDQQELPGG